MSPGPVSDRSKGPHGRTPLVPSWCEPLADEMTDTQRLVALCAALAALEAELREDSEEWADRIAALLKEHGG